MSDFRDKRDDKILSHKTKTFPTYPTTHNDGILVRKLSDGKPHLFSRLFVEENGELSTASK